MRSEPLGYILALVLLAACAWTAHSLSLHVLIHQTGIAMPAAHCGDSGAGTLQALSRGFHPAASDSLSSLPFPTPSLGPGSPQIPRPGFSHQASRSREAQPLTLFRAVPMLHSTSEPQLNGMGCPYCRPQSVTEHKIVTAD